MRTLFQFFFSVLILSSFVYSQKFAVTSGAWEGAIWANSAGGTAGETTPPTVTDDAVIKNGVSVTVSNASAQCRNLSFTDSTATIALNTGAVLSVAGNFSLASTNHRIFSAWESGAKLRFNGTGLQTISGFATGTSAAASTNPSTVLMEVVIDKPAGDTIRTPSSDMKLALGKSLDIVSGIFVLGTSDDINGRDLNFTATAPTITVEANGKLALLAGATHIRGGTSGTNPIGKMTIRGSVTVSTTSTNRLNIGNIDIESGGLLTLNTGWSSSNFNLFNPGIITVKEGGAVSHTTTTSIWATGTTMLLQKGGVYRTTSSALTIFPPTFSNNGTVRYSRTASAQPIVDMDYSRLEISFDSTKVWTLAGNRVISDSLEINNTALLKITGTGSVTVNGTLRLTSGTIDNSEAAAVLNIADNGSISRATGMLVKEPGFAGPVNVRYTSSTQTVATGAELPAAEGKLKKLTIAAPRGVNLNADVTVNDSLVIDDGYLFLGDKQLTLASAAHTGGTFSDTSMVVQSGSGALKAMISSPKRLHFPVGDTAAPAVYTPATLNFTSGSFSNASVSVKVHAVKHPALNAVDSNVINRYWKFTHSGISNFSADAEFRYAQSDVVGAESTVVLGQYNGSVWNAYAFADVQLNRLSGTVTELSEFTGVAKGSITSALDGRTTVPTEFSLGQNYPNPFNPSTTIQFQLPARSHVTLKVYDLLGKEVATLVQSEQAPGIHTVRFDAVRFASGVYYYRLTAGTFVQVKKMLVQK
ncbi:MAG: T9SS type A sorting domain-containing protein [Bacteroidetes bacterium]|nr:T9SS type A sorting domain-containing protein [Bacteroidota bacterium]